MLEDSCSVVTDCLVNTGAVLFYEALHIAHGGDVDKLWAKKQHCKSPGELNLWGGGGWGLGNSGWTLWWENTAKSHVGDDL